MTETPTVHQAWAEVMGDVQAVRKGERANMPGSGGFNFRGIDAVVNAVGPALRKHGVSVIPEALDIQIERYQTAKGGQMLGAIVKMQYTIHGPAGDSMTGSAYGQAADAGDKAVSKAESVAFRTFLLQSLTIPTDEPDPDYSVHERVADIDRGQASRPTSNGVPPPASEAQLKAVHAALGKRDLTTDEQRHKVGSWAMQQVHPGHPGITSMRELTAQAASHLIDYLNNNPKERQS